MKYKDDICQFITEKFLFGEEKEINDHDSLLEAGIIDSTGILELISYLEDHFKIKVNDDELFPENLDSIANICSFLNEKMSK